MSIHRGAYAIALVFALSLMAPAGGARAASGAAAATSTVYLPNVTRMLGGPTGWQTPFIVQNIGTAPTDLEISFYGFADGALVAQRKVAGLRPGTSYALVPNNEADLPENGQFSVVIRSFGSPVVAVVNEHAGAGARAEALSYVGIGGGSTKVSLPYIAKEADGWLTTFIVQNVGNAATTVTASFVGFDGTTGTTLTRQIQPGRSAFVDPRAESSLQSGREYSVTLTADQPIGAVVNAHNDAPTVAAPRAFSYNGAVASGTTRTYFPYAAKSADGGRNTRLVLQNLGATKATPAVTLTRDGADPAILMQDVNVGPGASSSVDLAQIPFAAAEYGVTVSGGEFAILGITTNGTTATGATGSPATAKRLYLPNLTRSLGGARGWTTPIVVESSGATSATISWYRFADGSLVKAQPLTGLAFGRSVRVDPRSLSFLSDDTQYSAVVESADGTLSAVVLEYSDSGGDGAMAYEGFADPTAAPVANGPTPSAAPTPPTAPTPTSRPTATPTPARTVSQDPNLYWKTVPGYTYGEVSPKQQEELESAFASLRGRVLQDVAFRYVYQGGRIVAIGIDFSFNPDYINAPGAREELAAMLSQGNTTITLAGQTVIYDGSDPRIKEMMWIQKDYFVVVYGPSRSLMDPFVTGLITANK